MSIKSLMPSNHLILCHPLLLLPSIFPSIRVFSNESDLCIRWPKHWTFKFSISPSNEYSGWISFRSDWLDLLVVQATLNISTNSSQVFPFLHISPALVISCLFGIDILPGVRWYLIVVSVWTSLMINAKDGEALYSQQKQDQELTVAQTMNSFLPNSDWNWRK